MPLMLLLFATFSIGLYVYEQMLLGQAVRAGAQYAISFPTEIDGIKGKIRAALPEPLNREMLEPVVTTCHCDGNGSGCALVCADGAPQQTFVTISAALPAAPIVGSGFGAIPPPAVSYVVRVQ